MHYVRMTRTNSRPPALGTVGKNPVRLRPPRYRIERRAIYWWSLRAFLVSVLLLSLLGVAHFIWVDMRPWSASIFWILAAGCVPTVLVMPICRYLIHRWEITDKAAYALTGWLVREWRIAPVSRIQGVNTVRGPLQRLLGLATLRVTTASEEGTVVVPGLDAEVAAEVARELTEITWNTPGDAT